MVNRNDLKDINIGQLIQSKVDEKHIPYAEFARLINCARTSLYHIFNNKNIDIDRLILISDVLNYDFISEIYLNKLGGSFVSGNVERPSLVIPFKNGRLDLGELPESLLEMLKSELLSMK